MSDHLSEGIEAFARGLGDGTLEGAGRLLFSSLLKSRQPKVRAVLPQNVGGDFDSDALIKVLNDLAHEDSHFEARLSSYGAEHGLRFVADGSHDNNQGSAVHTAAIDQRFSINAIAKITNPFARRDNSKKN